MSNKTRLRVLKYLLANRVLKNFLFLLVTGFLRWDLLWLEAGLFADFFLGGDFFAISAHTIHESMISGLTNVPVDR